MKTVTPGGLRGAELVFVPPSLDLLVRFNGYAVARRGRFAACGTKAVVNANDPG